MCRRSEAVRRAFSINQFGACVSGLRSTVST
jgi:hypothetical protein